MAKRAQRLPYRLGDGCLDIDDINEGVGKESGRVLCHLNIHAEVEMTGQELHMPNA